MESSLTTHSRVATRIKSVDDPQLNEQLFTLYEQLIVPIREIENIYTSIECKRTKIQENKEYMKDVLYRVKGPGIFLSIISAVLTTVIGFSLNKQGVYTIFDTIYEIDRATSNTGLLVPFMMFIAIPLVVGFGTAIILVILKNKKIKHDNMQLEDEIVVEEKTALAKIEELDEVISFVPPNYRHSSALDYFVESYVNARVKNLQEAVNSYDTYCYRNEMLSIQNQISEQLLNIEYTQLETIAQLDKLNRSVWLANVIF